MTTVSILGTGMGQAIASLVTTGGNAAEIIGATDKDKDVTGDIVILCAPGLAIVATRGEQLAGKVVVDISNLGIFETFPIPVVPPTPLRRCRAPRSSRPSTPTSPRDRHRRRPHQHRPHRRRRRRRQGRARGCHHRGRSQGESRRGRQARPRENLEAFGFLHITLAAAEKLSWVGGFGVAG